MAFFKNCFWQLFPFICILGINLQNASTDTDEEPQELKRRRPVPSPRTAKGATFKWSDVDKSVPPDEQDSYQSDVTGQSGDGLTVKSMYSKPHGF